MNERKKGAILSYIQVFLSVVVSMIYVPVLLHFLGQSEYGLYQIVGSFFSYVTVFESCVSAGILRNYCNALGRSDHEEASVTLSMARSIYRFLALLLDFVGITVIFTFRSFYAASFTTSELIESIAILILLFVNMTFTLQGSVYLTVLTGHEKYTFLRILSILMQVIQPLLVILCVSRIPYAITVSVVIVLLNLLTIGIRYGYVTQKLKIRITKQPKDSRIVKSILGLSAAILLGSIADQIFWKTDQVILGRMFNTAVVAVYSVGAQIYMMYMQFGTQVSGVFYPKISALYQEENGLQKVSDLFIRIGRITFYVILLILSGFIIFGREFLLLWVGEGYEEAYWVAIIVMLPFSIDLAQNLGLCILQIKGQYSFRARIYFMSAVLNIVTTVYKLDWNCRCSAFNRCFHVPDQWGDYELVFPEKSWSGYQKILERDRSGHHYCSFVDNGCTDSEAAPENRTSWVHLEIWCRSPSLYGSLCGGHAWNRGQPI